MSIDLQGAPSMDQKILNSMRQNISNSLCTDPDLKDLLQKAKEQIKNRVSTIDKSSLHQ